MNTVGKRIAHARSQLGMSQSDLAAEIAVTQPAIYNIEKRPGSTKHIFAIARALQVNVEWLTTGKGPMRKGADLKLAKLAPEMFVALKDLLTCHELDEGWSDAWKAAKAVIDKAEI